jgi:hypothetical protein
MMSSVYRARDQDFDPTAFGTLTMEIPVKAKEHDLPRRAVLGFDVRTQSAIWCLGGEVWVTGPGLGDRVLEAGQSALVSSPGRVVVQALSPARVRVLGDRPPLSAAHSAP